MSFDRKRANAVATRQLRDWQSNSIADSHVHMVVNAVLDDVEEQLASSSAGQLGELHVVMFMSRPVVIALSRARARRRVKALIAAGGAKADYRIVPTVVDE